jgi:hypothetical protein
MEWSELYLEPPRATWGTTWLQNCAPLPQVQSNHFGRAVTGTKPCIFLPLFYFEGVSSSVTKARRGGIDRGSGCRDTS